MRLCPKCGSELLEQAIFCGECGNIVSSLPSRPSEGGGSPSIDIRSQDAPTQISDPLLPTFRGQELEQDIPTFISDPSLPTVLRPWMGWSDDQNVQNRQLPGDRQTEENETLPLLPDPLLLGPTPNSSPAGHVPMVQGTPQVGGVPSVQGTPSPLNSSPPAASNPLPAQGLGHSAAPSAAPLSTSVPPSASPQPQPVLELVETTQHPPGVISPRRKVRHKPHPKKRRQKFDEAIEKIVSYLLALSHVKNAKILLLLGAILLILGSAGVYGLDEKLEQGDAAGFLQFDEGIERQLSESVIHGRAHAIATAYAVAATGTATALQHPYPQGGELLYNDPMSNNSKAYKWVYGSQKTTWRDCFFANGGYHVTETQRNGFFYCIASNTNFSNFKYQVEMTFIQGDYGGILFRSMGKRHYIFRIGRDGSYTLQLYVDDTGRNTRLLALDRADAIQRGFNQTNLLTAVARGNNIDLYVNQHYLRSVQDSSFFQGQIGLEAEDHGVPSEVMFSNVKVWTL